MAFTTIAVLEAPYVVEEVIDKLVAIESRYGSDQRLLFFPVKGKGLIDIAADLSIRQKAQLSDVL